MNTYFILSEGDPQSPDFTAILGNHEGPLWVSDKSWSRPQYVPVEGYLDALDDYERPHMGVVTAHELIKTVSAYREIEELDDETMMFLLNKIGQEPE